MLEGKDEIKDLFSEKLNGFESEVRPEVWSKISSQIGTTAATSTGISVAMKVVIASTVAASIAGAVYLSNRNSKSSDNKKQDVVQTDTEISNSESLVPEVKTTEDELQVSQKEITKGLSSIVLKDNSVIPQLEKETPIEKELVTATEYPNEKTKPFSEEKMEEKESVEPNKSTENKPDPVVEEFERKQEVKAEYVLDLPNIFTPNSDGSNDFLSIKSENLTELNIVILDQNNKVVFSSDNGNFQWDGTSMSGDSIPNGNYVYYVTGRDANGKLISKFSQLTITR